MDDIESQIGPGKIKSPPPPAPVTAEPEEVVPKPLDQTAPAPLSTESGSIGEQTTDTRGSGTGELPPEPQESETGVLPPEPAADTGEPPVRTNGNIGDNYFSEFEKIGFSRWPASRIPIQVYIQPISKAKGFRPEFADILKQAFTEWAAAIPSVPIEFVSDPTFSQIYCTWTDNKADLVHDMEGGHTELGLDGQGIMHVDLKIYTLSRKDESPLSVNYIRRVALHEAGHSLGISGHSPEEGDVMFATTNPKDDVAAALSSRDKNTLVALYSKKLTASDLLNPAKTQVGLDTKSPKVRAIQLNNEASAAIQQQKMDVAKDKLAEAYKLDPTNRVICDNLGAIYANFGSMAAVSRNAPLASTYYKMALPYLEKGSNRTALMQVLSNYAQVLRMMNKQQELNAIEAKLRALKQ